MVRRLAGITAAGAVLLIVALALTQTAHADPQIFLATLDGVSESPPNASPGTGITRVTIDIMAHTMRVEATFSGLTGTTTASHIHAATATPFTGTAGVATQTPTFSGFPLGVTSGSYDSTFDMTALASYNAAFVTANGGTAASAEAALFSAIIAGPDFQKKMTTPEFHYLLGKHLNAIEQELGAQFPRLPLVRLIGDVKDLTHLRETFARWRPQVVFHAAAYKHVPLMEEHNAWAALRNNTLGTWLAARAAAEAGVGRFVLISTDKAVNPTNVMGATKRAAEMAICLLAPRHPGTRFIAVRFGNVLGSSGSVIPKFKEQIARGGPVTVTHPDIIRYFMTIPEAARLVLQAEAIGHSGQVLVLDMGEPVRILDLAREMIRLSGFTEDEIRIVTTGLRPGEKLFEEVLADDEHTLPTPHPKLRIARSRETPPAWLHELGDWLGDGSRGRSDADVRRTLRHWVPEYTFSETSAESPAADETVSRARARATP